MDERPNAIREYTKDGLTVVWQPHLCIHSMLCWRELVSVFDPRKRPWVNMEGATLEKIKAQVSRCPSAALSYRTSGSAVVNVADAANTDGTLIEVTHNGPLLIYGNISVKDHHGNSTQKSKVTALCRCGASGTKPYCDGSHIKIGFKDE